MLARASIAVGLGLAVASSGCAGDAFSSGSATAGAGGAAGATGSGGASAARSGCADGEREDFLDEGTYPDVAACAGGFVHAGVVMVVTSCDRKAGDDGANPDGQGCSVEDLCASGWHVCTSAADVAASAPGGCAGATAPDAFWVTRQSMEPGTAGVCGTGTNNLVGCGTIGVAMPDASCAPLSRALQYAQCAAMPPWSCGAATDADLEAAVATKPGPGRGGALCCRD